MSETTVLKSSASPKNASPHMAGGKNHVQIAPKPMVSVNMANGGPIQQTQRNKNVVVGQPQRQIAVRASAPQRQQADFNDGATGGGMPGNSPAPRAPADPNAPKPMISVRMDGVTPKLDNQRTSGGNTGNVRVFNRGSGPAGRPVSRRQGTGPFAQRSQAQAAQARGGAQAALPAGAVQVAVTSSLSADHLMCCRHAVNQYLKTEGEGVNEIVAALAKSTLDALDAELAARANPQVIEAEPEPEAEVAPQRRQIQSGSGPRSGVPGPRRFDGRGANPVRRVVPAPMPTPSVDAFDAGESGGDVSDDPSFEGSSTVDGNGVTSGVIDIEPND